MVYVVSNWASAVCAACAASVFCVQIAGTGDIVVLGGMKDVTPGDTLCDEKRLIMLECMEFPDPVI